VFLREIVSIEYQITMFRHFDLQNKNKQSIQGY